MKSRLGIFACYLGDGGEVEKYIIYLLQDMLRNLDSLIIVCNGELSNEGRGRLEEFSDAVIVRENRGLDAAAWQFAMTKLLGWEKVQKYDELVLFNDTFFGPFYPFSQVFEKMDRMSVDFWGLTCHYEAGNFLGNSPYGYVPTHIQSYFTVIGKRLLRSNEFRRYWDELPVFDSFSDAVGKHEIVFTRHFQDEGFTWSVYVDASSRKSSGRGCNYNFCAYEPYWLVAEKKLPILKKKNFTYSTSLYLRKSYGNEMHRCMEYIERHTNYDVNLIWDYILKRDNITDVFNVINLRHVLPVNFAPVLNKNILNKTLVILCVDFIDNIDFIKKYLLCIPEEIHVLLVTSSDVVLKSLHTCFDDLQHVEIRRAENTGKIFLAKSEYIYHVVNEYKYVCVVHDEDVSGNVDISSITRRDHQEGVWENLLGSKEYILNVLQLFEMNKRMGMAVVPPSSHSVYGDDIGNLWAGCFEYLIRFATQLRLSVPIDEGKAPIQVGNSFWFRREALQILFNNISFCDGVLEESGGLDDNKMCAIELLCPFVAQQNGYYTAMIFTPSQASIYLRNNK